MGAKYLHIMWLVYILIHFYDMNRYKEPFHFKVPNVTLTTHYHYSLFKTFNRFDHHHIFHYMIKIQGAIWYIYLYMYIFAYLC